MSQMKGMTTMELEQPKCDKYTVSIANLVWEWYENQPEIEQVNNYNDLIRVSAYSFITDYCGRIHVDIVDDQNINDEIINQFCQTFIKHFWLNEIGYDNEFNFYVKLSAFFAEKLPIWAQFYKEAIINNRAFLTNVSDITVNTNSTLGIKINTDSNNNVKGEVTIDGNSKVEHDTTASTTNTGDNTTNTTGSNSTEHDYGSSTEHTGNENTNTNMNHIKNDTSTTTTDKTTSYGRTDSKTGKDILSITGDDVETTDYNHRTNKEGTESDRETDNRNINTTNTVSHGHTVASSDNTDNNITDAKTGTEHHEDMSAHADTPQDQVGVHKTSEGNTLGGTHPLRGFHFDYASTVDGDNKLDVYDTKDKKTGTVKVSHKEQNSGTDKTNNNEQHDGTIYKDRTYTNRYDYMNGSDTITTQHGTDQTTTYDDSTVQGGNDRETGTQSVHTTGTDSDQGDVKHSVNLADSKTGKDTDTETLNTKVEGITNENSTTKNTGNDTTTNSNKQVNNTDSDTKTNTDQTNTNRGLVTTHTEGRNNSIGTLVSELNTFANGAYLNLFKDAKTAGLFLGVY